MSNRRRMLVSFTNARFCKMPWKFFTTARQRALLAPEHCVLRSAM